MRKQRHQKREGCEVSVPFFKKKKLRNKNIHDLKEGERATVDTRVDLALCKVLYVLLKEKAYVRACIAFWLAHN